MLFRSRRFGVATRFDEVLVFLPLVGGRPSEEPTQRLFEPEYSLRLGTTYFRQMLGMFDNRVELALAGYNGGPGRIGRLWREQQAPGEVDRFLEGLTLVESRNYVKRILVLAESYRSLYSDLS